VIGAGVFAAFGPAARAAGTGLLIGLAITAVITYCTATASAQLAAVYPTSGRRASRAQLPGVTHR
jgi:APA family basic amino acid/polyamine antiporter